MALLDLPPEMMKHDHDCGEAAARCALGFLRVPVPVKLACEIDGTDPRTIEAHLRRIGLRVQSGEMSVEDLRHHAAEGRPVLLLVHWPRDTSSHWCVSRGVSRGRVWIHDPDTGRASMPTEEFVAAWSASDARMSRPFRCWGIAVWVP